MGALCALSLVSSHRSASDALYENEFGFTRLRLGVMAAELWAGRGVRASSRRGDPDVGSVAAPGGAGVGRVGLLGFALLNPDGYIAERTSTATPRPGESTSPTCRAVRRRRSRAGPTARTGPLVRPRRHRCRRRNRVRLQRRPGAGARDSRGSPARAVRGQFHGTIGGLTHMIFSSAWSRAARGSSGVAGAQ
ncbi:DUF4173 domain-containing protein [Rhodococcus hoagii]|nr:DUF4173 domain-containing protein [Prescottella equi]